MVWYSNAHLSHIFVSRAGVVVTVVLAVVVISVLIFRAGQLGALIKYTSRLEGNTVSNQTNLIRTSNKYCCKYKCHLSSFG